MLNETEDNNAFSGLFKRCRNKHLLKLILKDTDRRLNRTG